MSAEQSQQSLAGPGKQKDFAKPPEASGGSENPTTKQEDNDTDKRIVPLASHLEGVKRNDCSRNTENYGYCERSAR